MDDSRKAYLMYAPKLRAMSQRILAEPGEPHPKRRGYGIERKKTRQLSQPLTLENAESVERKAARFLTKCLAECYSFEVSSVDGDLWERYRRFIRTRWGLSQSESRVAIECLRGFRNTKIAVRLAISAETVNRQLDLVYRKAGVRSRSELAAMLLQLAGSGIPD